MKIVDDGLLSQFRGCLCEWCRLRVYSEAAHIFSRGAGQVDIRENLVALCRFCHDENHRGHEPMRDQLLMIAAKRENTTQDKIKREVWRIRRLPKDADPGKGYRLSPTGWKQVDRTLGINPDDVPGGKAGPAPRRGVSGVPSEGEWQCF